MTSNVPIIGVIIAGGESSRMGHNDKCLLSLNNKCILSEIIDRLTPQVDQIIINANGNPARFDFTNLPIIEDILEEQQGPLAGIYTAMVWAKDNISQDAIIACVPSDTPFIPKNLVEKLNEAYKKQKADIACATSGGHLHPIFSLMPVSLHRDLHNTLTTTNTRAIYKWFNTHRLIEVLFQKNKKIDPFFNINTPEDFINIKKLLKE